MPDEDLPRQPSEALRAAIAAVRGKRPRTVLDHILAHGFITTDELKQLYGYNHPPRAARDVREAGIKLETFRVTGSDGRSIAAYRLDQDATPSLRQGRRAFSKAFKDQLLELYGTRCGVCSGRFPPLELQIDHRIPYEIAGDDRDRTPAPDEYMLLCASCNRSKSWTCEHCPNWTVRDEAICVGCGWASPDHYDHVATRPERRLILVWQSGEVTNYSRLENMAEQAHTNVNDYAKSVLDENSNSEDSQ